MLLNSIRLFEAPLQHLNLIQNLSQKVVTVGCMAFFLSLLFLSISSLEQADLVNLLCYLICHVRDLFLKFFICTDFNPLPYFFFIWFSPLRFLLSFSRTVRYFLHVDSQIPVLFLSVSNVDRAIIWNIFKKKMISMYLLVLIRIPNAMKRKHEQWNKHVFSSWQNNERVDIVKLICVQMH